MILYVHYCAFMVINACMHCADILHGAIWFDMVSYFSSSLASTLLRVVCDGEVVVSS